MWLSLVSHNYGSSVTSCAQVVESLAGQCERAAKESGRRRAAGLRLEIRDDAIGDSTGSGPPISLGATVSHSLLPSRANNDRWVKIGAQEDRAGSE
jgi:hypothetical protein